MGALIASDAAKFPTRANLDPLFLSPTRDLGNEGVRGEWRLYENEGIWPYETVLKQCLTAVSTQG